MKVLVLSKTSIPEANRTIPDWDPSWVTAVTESPHGVGFTPDAIISMGVGVMQQTYSAIERWPDALLFCYNWDCYEWVWERPRPGEYDYDRYGELLKTATEIWVPSACTASRTHQWWHLPSKVIFSSAPYWDHSVTPGDYALCTLRRIPDQDWDLFEQACESLGIPYRMTNHEATYAKYQKEVAGCKFLVSHLYEASTGGLSLLEGYYLGKPVLISSSSWNGANEYFQGRGTRFTSIPKLKLDGLKAAIDIFYTNAAPQVEPDHKQWVIDNFSSSVMVAKMKERIDAFSPRS